MNQNNCLLYIRNLLEQATRKRHIFTIQMHPKYHRQFKIWYDVEAGVEYTHF